MAKSKRKRVPKTVLKLPDLEQSKSAVLNSLTSASSKRSYDHAIREFMDWYCSEPRLAFNRTVVTRYRIALEQHPHALSTINLRLAAIHRLAYEAHLPGNNLRWPSGALRDFPSCMEMKSNLELVEKLYCCSDPVAFAILRPRSVTSQ